MDNSNLIQLKALWDFSPSSLRFELTKEGEVSLLNNRIETFKLIHSAEVSMRLLSRTSFEVTIRNVTSSERSDEKSHERNNCMWIILISFS